LQIFAAAGLIYLAINWLVALAGDLIERSLPGLPR
jgi:polar amino acid transport system permease protein